MVGTSAAFKSKRVPSTRKQTPQMAKAPMEHHERISYRSAIHALVVTTPKAIAYGGTAKSWALRPWNPRPCTTVGVKREMLEKPTEYATQM